MRGSVWSRSLSMAPSLSGLGAAAVATAAATVTAAAATPGVEQSSLFPASVCLQDSCPGQGMFDGRLARASGASLILPQLSAATPPDWLPPRVGQPLHKEPRTLAATGCVTLSSSGINRAFQASRYAAGSCPQSVGTFSATTGGRSEPPRAALLSPCANLDGSTRHLNVSASVVSSEKPRGPGFCPVPRSWPASLPWSSTLRGLRDWRHVEVSVWLRCSLLETSPAASNSLPTQRSVHRMTAGMGRGLGEPLKGDSPAATLHQWHFRKAPDSINQQEAAQSKQVITKRAGQKVEGEGEGESGRTQKQHPESAVVLLGWLGAKQRHLRRYAEWYNAQGIDAITFIIPMPDLLSLNPTERAEEHVENLVAELERWLDEDEGGEGGGEGSEKQDSSSRKRRKEKRSLVFHTFSNTGWLTYGAVLKRLQQRHGTEETNEMVKGCVVDSAPAVRLDPQIFAAGFAAAILGQRSSSTRVRNVVLAEEVHPPAVEAKGVPAVEAKRVSVSGVAMAAEVPLEPEGKGSVGERGRGKGRREHPQTPPDSVSESVERRQELQRRRLGVVVSHDLGHAVSQDDVDALLIRVGEKRRMEGEGGDEVSDGERACSDKEHIGALEWTLKAFLTRFFAVVLETSTIRRKLEELTGLLEQKQPPCPQLYIYSEADMVIPAKDIEEFMEIQKMHGVSVTAKRFLNSPHVDHYRTFPEVYTGELRAFLDKIGLKIAHH